MYIIKEHNQSTRTYQSGPTYVYRTGALPDFSGQMSWFNNDFTKYLDAAGPLNNQ